MTDLVERMRAKLAHGHVHRMLAVAVDVEDLDEIVKRLDAPARIAWLPVEDGPLDAPLGNPTLPGWTP